jgi:GNAT superfamily N-acetyltransferase
MHINLQPVSHIRPEDWPYILRIQSEAYSAIEPESPSVMQSKWLCSPRTCLVFRDGQQKPLAYLLSHPWSQEKPPSLGQEIPRDLTSDQLYLHDLAVSSAARGTGAASRLVQHLLDLARSENYRQVRLISIQASLPFWQKQGFVPDTSVAVCKTYGTDASYMVLNLQDS